MATKKKLATYDARLGVIYSRGNGVRHITSSMAFPQPVCGEPGYHWSASATAKTHARPLCKKCVRYVDKLKALLDADQGYIEATIGKEKMLEDAKAEFMELLADYEDEFASENSQ